MRLTAEDHPETIRRYAHLRPAGGWKAAPCAVKCPGSSRTCTRREGHRGPHASHGWLGKVVAVWTEGAEADGALESHRRARRPRDRVRRARKPIGLRSRSPTGVLTALRDLASHVGSSIEEWVWLAFAVVFAAFAIGGFLLITLG